MKYHGKISFTMDKGHADIDCVKDWTEEKVFTFDDIYTFDEDYPKENAIAYIKNDLSLVAGGGYETKHIHNVEFEIERL